MSGLVQVKRVGVLQFERGRKEASTVGVGGVGKVKLRGRGMGQVEREVREGCSGGAPLENYRYHVRSRGI